jgi:Cu/Zn superoxide dismutase
VSSPVESTRRTLETRQEADSPTHAVNPHNKTHGAPGDEERHVGDLGNIKTDGQGNSKGSVQDKLIKLIGSESVIGVRLLYLPPLSI